MHGFQLSGEYTNIRMHDARVLRVDETLDWKLRMFFDADMFQHFAMSETSCKGIRESVSA